MNERVGGCTKVHALKFFEESVIRTRKSTQIEWVFETRLLFSSEKRLQESCLELSLGAPCADWRWIGYVHMAFL